MYEAADGRKGHRLVGEDLAPFAERLVGRNQHRTPLITRCDQFEQHAGFSLIFGDVSEVIEDKQIVAVEFGDRIFKSELATSDLELLYEIGCAREQYAPPILAGGANLLTRLVAPEHIGAGVRWIGKDAEHPRMGQRTPDELAIPGAAILAARKAKTALLEALNHAIGAALLLKQLEDCSNGALYFLVRIKNDVLAVEYQTNWQREAQLTLLRFVEFAAVEARANNVQFGLSERAFHAKDQAVVEVGRVVATIAVEHQCLVTAQSSNNRCQSLFERARREDSREKIAPTCPIATSLTRVLKSSRLVVSCPNWPRSPSRIRICSGVQPSASAWFARLYWRSVLC